MILIIPLLLCLLSSGISPPFALAGQSLVVDDKSEPKSVVVYAVRRIPRGAVISNRDLEETIINSRGVKSADIAIRQFLIGRRAKYEIMEGQVILENCLVPCREKRAKQLACLKHFASFVQAKNDIPCGAVVTDADLRTGSVMTIDSADWLSRVDEAVGRKAKCAIFRGQIITKFHFFPATADSGAEPGLSNVQGTPEK